MALAERRAEVVWRGSLSGGEGMLSFDSGAYPNKPVTWASRTESPNGLTSPEELIAAAQAACYAMALSHTLSQAGHEPEHLAVSCTCTLDIVGGGPKVTTLEINARGRVPGIDAADFDRYGKEAEQGCPVANAFKNNVEIKLTSTLE